MAVDQVFTRSSQHNLSGDTDLRIFLKADGRLLLVAIVENDCYAGFRYSGLSTLVYEILEAESILHSAMFKSKHTCKFCARTVVMFVIPKTKHIESRMLDFPLPFRPVIELKDSSLSCRVSSAARGFWLTLFIYHPEITVRTAYDLKPYHYQQIY